jgi:hypothetical protein
MSDSGGGWTLALKVPGDTTTFDLSYDSSYWTSPPITHGKPTLTQNAAMYPAYEEVPFTEIMITMAAVSASAPSTLLVLPVSDSTSLRDLIASSAPNTVTTSLPRTSWTALTTPTATVQTQCGAQGINLTTTSTTFTAQQYARVRIGFLASRTAGCATPDSYIGIGGEAGTSDTSCDPSTPYSGPTAGSAGAVNCSGGADVTDFGFVWVR